jgi:hypothetical protein
MQPLEVSAVFTRHPAIGARLLAESAADFTAPEVVAEVAAERRGSCRIPLTLAALDHG